jgi:predicted N-acetyltransferase YhbS
MGLTGVRGQAGRQPHAIRQVNLAAFPSAEEADLVDALRASDAVRALGEKLVIVLGHPAHYPRFGFIPASALGIHASFEVPDDALMTLAPDPASEPPRGAIVCPPPFGV